MQEMKAEEESKHKKKGGKSRSPTKTPGKRPGSERKSESAQKKDKAGSGTVILLVLQLPVLFQPS